MENVQGRCVVGKFTGLLASFLVFLSSYSAHMNASETQKTLVLIGGALTTCSSMSSQNCENKTQLEGKKSNRYHLTDDALNKIKSQWVNDNIDNRNKVLQLLATVAVQHPSQIDKSTLLWTWRDLDNGLLNKLTDQEYNFVIDTLEVPVTDANNKRIKEAVNTKMNTVHAANDILDFVSATAKVNVEQPILLAITASSRDPYESADFYEGLLSFDGIETHWLALTPALAQAITAGRCEDLGSIREQSMQLFNRQQIYPDRTDAEQALCEQGVDNLVKTINSATGIMLNGGDQSLTRKVLYDESGKAYPWTQAIRTRSLLVGTSAGTA
ncbi:MAG: cyanophycinase, partial [Pseudoalteromonas sp.]